MPLPQTGATQQLLQSELAQCRGNEDYAAIVKTAARAAGLEA